MSLAAIESVTSAEKQAEEIKQNARAEAGQIIEAAHKQGKEFIDAAKNKAQAEIALMEKDILAKAQAKSEKTAENTAGFCRELKEKGESRLQEAVSIIVGRVVNE